MIAKLIVTVCLLLTGCVSVAFEPDLPFPERPAVQFKNTPSGVCVSEDDAQAMLRWIQKLNEFEAARARQLKREPDVTR